MRLQNVAAYRELRRSVQKSEARERCFRGAVMLEFAYYLHSGGNTVFVLLYAILAAGELAVGLFKWFVPVAEGLILDALVLLVFALFNLGLSCLRFKAGFAGQPTGVCSSGFTCFTGAYRRVREYGRLRA